MLAWLRSFFSKPELPVRRLTFEQLPSFIEEQKKDVEKRLSEALSEKTVAIEAHKKTVKDLLSKLETGTLHNPNIPNKERQIMEGNRGSYIKHARILLHQLKVPHTLEDVQHRHSEAHEAIKHYETTTMKPMKILFHFFEHETRQIHRKIGVIMKTFDQMQDLLNDGVYTALREVQQACDAYHMAITKRKQIAVHIKDQEKLIADRKQKLTASTEKLETFRKSDAFLKATDARKKLADVKDERKGIEQQVIAQFAKLERAIRKHERIALGSISLSNPVVAVRQPKECIEALKQVQGAIQRGTIDLKNAEKIADELERMPAFVTDVSEKLERITADEASYEASLDTAVFEEEQQLVAQIEGVQQTLAAMKQQLDELQASYAEIRPEKYIAEAGKAVSKIEGVEFTSASTHPKD